MKKIFAILQRGDVVAMLAMLFIGAPSIITYVAQTYGNDAGFLIHISLIIVSMILSTFLFWSLTAKWNVERIGYLIASCGAGFGGLVLTVNMMLGIHQIISPSTFGTLHMFGSVILIVLACWGVFIEWVVKPWQKD